MTESHVFSIINLLQVRSYGRSISVTILWDPDPTVAFNPDSLGDCHPDISAPISNFNVVNSLYSLKIVSFECFVNVCHYNLDLFYYEAFGCYLMRAIEIILLSRIQLSSRIFRVYTLYPKAWTHKADDIFFDVGYATPHIMRSELEMIWDDWILHSAGEKVSINRRLLSLKCDISVDGCPGS